MRKTIRYRWLPAFLAGMALIAGQLGREVTAAPPANTPPRLASTPPHAPSPTDQDSTAAVAPSPARPARRIESDKQTERARSRETRIEDDLTRWAEQRLNQWLDDQVTQLLREEKDRGKHKGRKNGKHKGRKHDDDD